MNDDGYCGTEENLARMRAEYYADIAKLWAEYNANPARRAEIERKQEEAYRQLEGFEAELSEGDRWLCGPAK